MVVGGYDPSLAPEMYEDPGSGVDAIVRGEGDITFRDLLRALGGSGGPLRGRRRCRSGIAIAAFAIRRGT